MKLNGLLIFAALILVGCVSSSVERIGTVSYTPRPPNSEVVVFTDASQIKEPYDVVGIISYDNPGKYQILSLGDAIEPLKTKAREIGANAIIIDKSQPVKSGIISTGIWAEARAIRLRP
jgi:PBP1b-binding outer membrane lipoprotein LpoB